MRRGLERLLLTALLLVPSLSARAGEPVAEDHVVLHSGRILAGRIVGTVKIEKTQLLQVKTDFGQILVPRTAVKKRVEAKRKKGEDPGVFQIRAVRILRWEGTVEKKPADGGPWRAIDAVDRYSKRVELNEANAYVSPGDSLRTGFGSSIDLMPHKDVWIRIAPESEVTIPRVTAGVEPEATLELKRGKTFQRVHGRPRGRTYRIKTPSSVVDHEFVQGGTESFFSLQTAETDRVVVSRGAVKIAGAGIVKAGQAKSSSDEAPSQASQHAIGAFEDDAPRFPVEDMVYVPAGRYAVGGQPHGFTASGEPTTWSEAGCRPFQVDVEAFLIDRREVSAAEFHAWVVATRPEPWAGFSGYDKPDEKGARLPVVHQSWEAAMRFAAWCGKTLPTEAQYEVAAHGGTRRRYPWGNQFTPAHRQLHFAAVSKQRFHPVGQDTVDVSPFGVQSLASNAVEWCRDDWKTSPFFKHMLIPSACEGKALRGEASTVRLRWCNRATGQGKNSPGFRCVVELK